MRIRRRRSVAYYRSPLHRLWTVVAALAVAAPIAVVAPVTASAAPPVREPAPAAPRVAATEEAAVAAAARSGQRVEVLAERTVYSQTFAEPTGRLTYEDDPESSTRYRSFFQFPTTEIRYKHVESAYV